MLWPKLLSRRLFSPRVCSRRLLSPRRLSRRLLSRRLLSGSLLPPVVSFAFRCEGVPRIAMLSAWAPIAIASDARTLKIGLRVVGRRPQPASGKPLHLSVGMLLANPIEGRQQVRALSGTKCGRQPARENRPV
jgi:hypothetical protein